MNIIDNLVAIGLGIDAFFKGADRVIQRCEELGNAFTTVTEGVSGIMNTVTEVADGTNGAVADLVFRVDSAQVSFDNLTIGDKLLVIISMVRELIDTLAYLGTRASEAFTGMIAKVDELTKAMREASDGGGGLWEILSRISIALGIATSIITLANAFNLLASAIAYFTTKKGAIAAVIALLSGTGGLIFYLTRLGERVDELSVSIPEAWEKIKNKVKAAIDGLLESIPPEIIGLIKFLKKHWDTIPMIITNPIGLARRYLMGETPLFGQWASDTVDKVRDGFESMAEVGENLVIGFVQGVQAWSAWAYEQVCNFFARITNGVRNLFGINSPSRVFAGIGKNLGEGLVDGIESMEGRVDKTMAGMMDTLVKSAEGADLERSLSYLSRISGRCVSTDSDHRSELSLFQMFSDTYDRVKAIIIAAFEAISRKAQEIVRRMTISIDEFLRSAGFQTGRNFFGALGDGLIAKEGRLMSEAMRVADGISEVFNRRQNQFMPSYAGFDSGAFSPMRAGLEMRDDYMTVPVEQNVNQYFYDVAEKQTAFQAYRAAQKAFMYDMGRRF
ncbi:MAG: hypothetical protein FWE24_09225 [Defluviitaleaceae bacterium]|nr:hypothetical protein [Defluviitaleaceae bacterium]